MKENPPPVVTRHGKGLQDHENAPTRVKCRKQRQGCGQYGMDRLCRKLVQVTVLEVDIAGVIILGVVILGPVAKAGAVRENQGQ